MFWPCVIGQAGISSYLAKCEYGGEMLWAICPPTRAVARYWRRRYGALDGWWSNARLHLRQPRCAVRHFNEVLRPVRNATAVQFAPAPGAIHEEMTVKRTSRALARALRPPSPLTVVGNDYLNIDQLNLFRDILRAQHDTLLAAADTAQTHLRDDDNTAADPSDRASLEEDYTMALLVQDRDHNLLIRIEAALSRIDAGTFGICLETGEPIAVSRLIAEPTALYNLEVQERYETLRRLGR